MDLMENNVDESLTSLASNATHNRNQQVLR